MSASQSNTRGGRPDHARSGDRTVDADGELDLDLARGARAQGFGRIARRRRADRTQLGGRGRGAARGLGLAAFGFQTLGLAARGFLARRLLACGLLARRLFLRGLLRGQFARCLFLGQALLLLALALELALALRLLFGGELLLAARRAASASALAMVVLSRSIAGYDESVFRSAPAGAWPAKSPRSRLCSVAITVIGSRSTSALDTPASAGCLSRRAR